MKLPRFFAPGVSAVGDEVELPAGEGRHLARVLRLKAGETVRVFDGRGREFVASVARVRRTGVRIRTVSAADAAPEPAVAITLGLAALKGGKMDEVVRDAVMLGVAAIQPIVTTRTNVPGTALRRSRLAERWRRIAVASAKQCGRAVVPEVAPAVEISSFVRDCRTDPRLILVEPGVPGVQVESLNLGQLRAVPRPASATIAVGPEGGWAEEEVAAAVERGFVPLTLGRLTLRADAAPVTAITALRVVWNDW